MIRFDGVTKSYNGAPAINDLSLALKAGQTVALIGPSGCGKSTLLSLLVGLITPDRGAVTIDGTTLTASSALRLRRRMGYVIQDGGLFPHLTARENVVIMARELGWSADRRRDRLEELRTLTRLSPDTLDRYPVELSGGQRQRVSLMRALMLDPDIVVLDEPLGALDPMIRADLQDDLKAIFLALGRTVLLVTHDLAEAAFLGDRIVLMNRGRIEQDGNFQELLDRPASTFVQQFVKAQDRRFAGSH